MRKRETWKAYAPVRELEPQSVPPFRPPAFGDAVTLNHKMPTPAPAQLVAHRDPSLAAADDQGFNSFDRHETRAAPCRWCSSVS
jgi:hypothetical protein